MFPERACEAPETLMSCAVVCFLPTYSRGRSALVSYLMLLFCPFLPQSSGTSFRFSRFIPCIFATHLILSLLPFVLSTFPFLFSHVSSPLYLPSPSLPPTSPLSLASPISRLIPPFYIFPSSHFPSTFSSVRQFFLFAALPHHNFNFPSVGSHQPAPPPPPSLISTTQHKWTPPAVISPVISWRGGRVGDKWGRGWRGALRHSHPGRPTTAENLKRSLEHQRDQVVAA